MTITVSHVRGTLRLIGFILIILCAAPVLVFADRFLKEERRVAVVRGSYRLLPRLLGIKLVVYGKPIADRPCLYVANHLSYLDIPVLGSILKSAFISRGDVAGWPVIGWLAKQQRVMFITRRKNTAVAEAKMIRDRLEAGERLLMFPEGTSSDGQHVLPFKSTFFAVAQPVTFQGRERQVTVQPVSMALTERGNLPIGRHQRPLYCWYGDMEFAPHFWDVLQQPGFTVEVRFHPATTLAAMDNDRKKLAHYCEETIAHGLSDGLAGRRPVQGL